MERYFNEYKGGARAFGRVLQDLAAPVKAAFCGERQGFCAGSRRQFFRFVDIFYLVLDDKFHLTGVSGHLLDGHLQKKAVFLFYVT